MNGRGRGNGVCHVSQLNAHPTHPSMGRVSIIDQNITRAGEGIASTDGTGRSADGTCDLCWSVGRPPVRKRSLNVLMLGRTCVCKM